jgi:CheY-like chemotaxis protein
VVLLLDGDSALTRTLPRYLDGWQVLPVRDLGQARILADERSPRALIVTCASEDQALARLGAARASFRDLPIAVCTLLGRQSPAGKLGVAEYLLKPITREQLARALAGLGRRVRDIVIVEDEAEMSALLARLVRGIYSRCRVREAPNGIEGLALIRERRPDVVLLDLLMPQMDGYELVRRMHEDAALRDVPVVVITAHGNEDETVVASTLIASTTGGFSMRELSRCLTDWLEVLDTPAPWNSTGDSAPALPVGRAG